MCTLMTGRKETDSHDEWLFGERVGSSRWQDQGKVKESARLTRACCSCDADTFEVRPSEGVTYVTERNCDLAEYAIT